MIQNEPCNLQDESSLCDRDWMSLAPHQSALRQSGARPFLIEGAFGTANRVRGLRREAFVADATANFSTFPATAVLDWNEHFAYRRALDEPNRRTAHPTGDSASAIATGHEISHRLLVGHEFAPATDAAHAPSIVTCTVSSGTACAVEGSRNHLIHQPLTAVACYPKTEHTTRGVFLVRRV